jgi:hypothetical protein
LVFYISLNRGLTTGSDKCEISHAANDELQ